MKALLARIGATGTAGVVLLVGCLVYFLAATLPARAERDDLAAQRDRLTAAAQARQPGRPAGPAAALPSVAQAPELLKQLNALAQKDGVAITRSAYQMKQQDSQRRLEVDLPLKASYPTLRAYLRDVLTASPAARLDDLNLHRATAGDPTVDADVRFSFGFASS